MTNLLLRSTNDPLLAITSHPPTTTLPSGTSGVTGAAPVATTLEPFDFATSKIVRTAIAAGVIVIILTGLVLFYKISAWIRYNQRLHRQSALTTLLQGEQRMNAYEIAAWADEPGVKPVRGGEAIGEKKVKKAKTQKRGGANAHAVHEWEGVAQ